MTDKNHAVISIEHAKSWVLSNINKTSKASLFIDSSFLSSDIVEFLNKEGILKHFSFVVINGNIKSENKFIFNDKNIPCLGIITKKIECPFPFSISIGRKSYLYLDQEGNFRSSKDDSELGRLIDSIHGSLESLSWK